MTTYGRGKRPPPKNGGTLMGAALAVWTWLLGVSWLIGWTVGWW